jgi:hypothetical protein
MAQLFRDRLQARVKCRLREQFRIFVFRPFGGRWCTRYGVMDQAAAMNFVFGDAERSEGASRLGLAHSVEDASVEDASEVDVLADSRRDMADQVIGQIVPFGHQALDGT